MDNYLRQQIREFIEEHGMRKFLDDLSYIIDEDLGKKGSQ